MKCAKPSATDADEYTIFTITTTNDYVVCTQCTTSFIAPITIHHQMCACCISYTFFFFVLFPNSQFIRYGSESVDYDVHHSRDTRHILAKDQKFIKHLNIHTMYKIVRVHFQLFWSPWWVWSSSAKPITVNKINRFDLKKTVFQPLSCTCFRLGYCAQFEFEYTKLIGC